MSKIKYETKKIRLDIIKYLKNISIENLEKIFLNVCRYYNLSKPIIVDCKLDYDSIDIELVNDDNNFDSYILSFPLDDIFFLNVRKVDSNIYNSFQIIDNKVSLYEKVYENPKDKISITKTFTLNGNKFAIYHKNNNNYLEFQYFYNNEFINSKITIRITITKVYQEDLFIKSLLDEEDVKNIFELYKMIVSIINNKIDFIEIINPVNDEFDEIIIVDNGKLIEYKRYIKVNDGFKLVEFDGNNIWVTKKEKVSDSDTIDEIKKIIK